MMPFLKIKAALHYLYHCYLVPLNVMRLHVYYSAICCEIIKSNVMWMA